MKKAFAKEEFKNKIKDVISFVKKQANQNLEKVAYFKIVALVFPDGGEVSYWYHLRKRKVVMSLKAAGQELEMPDDVDITILPDFLSDWLWHLLSPDIQKIIWTTRKDNVWTIE